MLANLRENQSNHCWNFLLIPSPHHSEHTCGPWASFCILSCISWCWGESRGGELYLPWIELNLYGSPPAWEVLWFCESIRVALFSSPISNIKKKNNTHDMTIQVVFYIGHYQPATFQLPQNKQHLTLSFSRKLLIISFSVFAFYPDSEILI